MSGGEVLLRDGMGESILSLGEELTRTRTHSSSNKFLESTEMFTSHSHLYFAGYSFILTQEH